MVYGKLVTVSVFVTGNAGTPTGTVRFYDGAILLKTATLTANGKATLTRSTLTVGTHNITVVYSGDTVYGPGKSDPLAVVVTSTAGGRVT